MTRIASAATALALAAAGLPAAGQTCLTFDTAVRLASDNDPDVLIAEADLQDAEAGLLEAKSLRRPQLSAFARTAVGDNGLVDSQFENQLGLRASQRVIDFGDARLARRAAREDVRAQESFVLDAAVRAALEAGSAYIDWLEAGAQLDATLGRLEYFSREENAINAALETGGATRADAAEIGAERAAAEAARFELLFERDQAAARVAIAARTREPLCPDTPASLAQTDIASGPNAADDLIADALAANARVEGLKRAAASRTAEARREGRARLPAVDVVGIVSYAGDTSFENFAFQERVGLNVSVPILTGSALAARARQARARAARAEGEVTQASRALEETVTITYQRVLLLEAQLGRRDAVLGFRTDEFAAAEAEYNQGLRTLPDLVETRLELERAALAEIQTRHALMRQRLTLRSLTGGLEALTDLSGP